MRLSSQTFYSQFNICIVLQHKGAPYGGCACRHVRPNGAPRQGQLLLRHERIVTWHATWIGLPVCPLVGMRSHDGSQCMHSVYAAAARVIAPGPSPSYTPLSHLVLFVQPHPHSTETYVVDVGFGGSGPIRPMLLSDSNEHPDDIVWGSLPPERHRMVRAGYPTGSLGNTSSSELRGHS